MQQVQSFKSRHLKDKHLFIKQPQDKLKSQTRPTSKHYLANMSNWGSAWTVMDQLESNLIEVWRSILDAQHSAEDKMSEMLRTIIKADLDQKAKISTLEGKMSELEAKIIKLKLKLVDARSSPKEPKSNDAMEQGPSGNSPVKVEVAPIVSPTYTEDEDDEDIDVVSNN